MEGHSLSESQLILLKGNALTLLLKSLNVKFSSKMSQIFFISAKTVYANIEYCK